MTSLTVPPAGGSLLGNRVLRTEDPMLLTGAARYLADLPDSLPREGLLYAAFVGSYLPHGTITSIDADDAREMAGVAAVWTAAELDVAPHFGFMPFAPAFARPPLAQGRVRFVGEPVAVVFADTPQQAADAAEAVMVELEPLPHQTDAEAALSPDSEMLFPEHGSNVALVESPDQPFDIDAESDVVVRGRYVNQRVAVAPMEPHCFAAAPAPDGRLTIWPSNQMPHVVHMQIAPVLGMSRKEIHVITPQVGGGFGGKAGLQHQYTVVATAARRLNRPVVWVPTRTEDMQGAPQSRGQVQYAELGCRSDGTFTGLKVRLVGDAGAYPSVGAFLPGGTRRMSHGTYNFGRIEFDIAVAVTNTAPMGAYRGAGRPEATALLERLVDQAARELGVDPIELRERNLLTDDVFPFTTITGNVYDSGSYRLPLRTAAEAIGYDELRREQALRRERGDTLQLGIGVACYVEITAGGNGSEFGRVSVHPDGTATVFAGTQSHGQGHQTAFAMIVSDQTGIPVEHIKLVDGDTDLVPRGGGTGGSRSLQLGGSAVNAATEVLVERAKRLAAQLLEADVADIVVDRSLGTIGVAGVPATALTWGELSAAANAAAEAGDEAEDAERGPLSADAVFEQAGATFPFGAHISLVEVDTETGRARLIRHVAVDDCGTVLNPLLVEGQQHGGIASGVGQALFEEVLYQDGNPVTSNFADYGLPSAAEMPSFETFSTETPSPLNPLGAKGIGEAATIGSTPAIQNAVIDAVSHLGVRHIDMPCTAQNVWNAVQAAAAGNADPWREPPSIFVTMAKGAEVDEEAAAAADGI